MTHCISSCPGDAPPLPEKRHTRNNYTMDFVDGWSNSLPRQMTRLTVSSNHSPTSSVSSAMSISSEEGHLDESGLIKSPASSCFSSTCGTSRQDSCLSQYDNLTPVNSETVEPALVSPATTPNRISNTIDDELDFAAPPPPLPPKADQLFRADSLYDNLRSASSAAPSADSRFDSALPNVVISPMMRNASSCIMRNAMVTERHVAQSTCIVEMSLLSSFERRQIRIHGTQSEYFASSSQTSHSVGMMNSFAKDPLQASPPPLPPKQKAGEQHHRGYAT